MFRYTHLILLSLVLAAVVPSASTGANIARGIDNEGDHYLTFDGVITAGDAAKFAYEIEVADAAGYRLDAVRLNSQGGNVWEAFQIAIMVRSVTGMATTVLKRSVWRSKRRNAQRGGRQTTTRSRQGVTS